jgi:hypothetical protein
LRTVSTGPVSRELRLELRDLDVAELPRERLLLAELPRDELPRELFETLLRVFEALLRDVPCGRCRDERRVVDALLRLLLVWVAISLSSWFGFRSCPAATPGPEP